MKRRSFIATTGGGLAAMQARAADAKPAIIEMRLFKLRNTLDQMPRRASEFLEKHYLPALKRAGAGPVGVFGSLIAPGGPFLLTVTSLPGLAALEGLAARISSDKEFVKAQQEMAAGGLRYVRMESSLLRAFESIPNIETPPLEPKRAPRVFEIRTYESNNLLSLRRKIRMFNEGEIGIFRRLGMRPVFFGETIVGRNMPNLTYMLGYDNLAAREKAWRAFAGDPEWEKIRSRPGVSDAEIVSNISNIMVRPLPFSEIR